MTRDAIRLGAGSIEIDAQDFPACSELGCLVGYTVEIHATRLVAITRRCALRYRREKWSVGALRARPAKQILVLALEDQLPILIMNRDIRRDLSAIL